MLFKSLLATSALAATALAAPNAQWGQHGPPGRYTRPTTTSKSVSKSASTTSATSSGVVVDPTGGSTSDVVVDPTGTTSDVVVDPTGTTSDVVVDPTGGSTTDVIVDPTGDCTATTAVQTLTETATLVSTVTEVITVPGSGSNITIPGATGVTTVYETATVTVPYNGGNVTIPGPTGTSSPQPPTQDCITEEEADQLGDVFRLLIQEYSNELALAALTEDFVDYSSAVNIIMNKGAQYPKNITGPTFATRAQFMAGQGSQPLIPFERIFTVHGCDTVSVRWWSSRSASGQKTEVAAIPVVGNGILKAVRSEEPVQTHKGITYNWRVKELYSEFNAAAWLVNLGVFKPTGPVDYFNTNTTTKRSIDSDEHFDASLRGAMI